jgi:hypothetical protein
MGAAAGAPEVSPAHTPRVPTTTARTGVGSGGVGSGAPPSTIGAQRRAEVAAVAKRLVDVGISCEFPRDEVVQTRADDVDRPANPATQAKTHDSSGPAPPFPAPSALSAAHAAAPTARSANSARGGGLGPPARVALDYARAEPAGRGIKSEGVRPTIRTVRRPLWDSLSRAGGDARGGGAGRTESRRTEQPAPKKRARAETTITEAAPAVPKATEAAAPPAQTEPAAPPLPAFDLLRVNLPRAWIEQAKAELESRSAVAATEDESEV